MFSLGASLRETHKHGFVVFLNTFFFMNKKLPIKSSPQEITSQSVRLYGHSFMTIVCAVLFWAVLLFLVYCTVLSYQHWMLSPNDETYKDFLQSLLLTFLFIPFALIVQRLFGKIIKLPKVSSEDLAVGLISF